MDDEEFGDLCARGVADGSLRANPRVPGKDATAIHTATLPCAHCGDRTRHEVVGYVHEDGMRYMPVEVFRAWSKRVASAAPEEWAPVVRARR